MRRRVMTGPKSLDVLYTYTYNSNNYHTFVAPKSAYYYVECWGGQGNYGYNDSEDRFTRSNDPGYGGHLPSHFSTRMELSSNWMPLISSVFHPLRAKMSL